MTRKQKRYAIFSVTVVAFFAALVSFGVHGARLSAGGGATPVKNVEATVALAGTATPITTLEAPISPLAQSVASTSAVTGTVLALQSATHVKTPKDVRALYMTSCYGSQTKLRKHVIDMIKAENLNAIVIDVKDYTGYVSFDTGDARFSTEGSPCVVSDMPALLKELGDKNIYRIARVTVMQDPHYAESHPAQAVQWKTGGVWKDKKGLAFVDPADRDFWAYIRDLAKVTYAAGFDEINFDYVRFPTDGNLKNAKFPLSEKVAKDTYKDVVTATTTKTIVVTDKKTFATSTKTVVVTPGSTKRVLVSTMKSEVMKSFFEYIGKEMKTAGIPTSVDLFGLVTTARDDLGIGQVLEDAMPNFDYIAPMVYPSHYPQGAFGLGNPNHVPGKIIDKAMEGAVARAKAQGYGPDKFRTWIQDFSYGGHYGVPEIRAQIAGSHKNGVMSYMAWDPKNKYTAGAYK
jgi:hypothetical protein